MFGDVWLGEGFFRRAGSHGSTAGRMPAATPGNGFWRDAENGNRDGRAPQPSPSRAANGSLRWTIWRLEKIWRLTPDLSSCSINIKL